MDRCIHDPCATAALVLFQRACDEEPPDRGAGRPGCGPAAVVVEREVTGSLRCPRQAPAARCPAPLRAWAAWWGTTLFKEPAPPAPSTTEVSGSIPESGPSIPRRPPSIPSPAASIPSPVASIPRARGAAPGAGGPVRFKQRELPPGKRKAPESQWAVRFPVGMPPTRRVVLARHQRMLPVSGQMLAEDQEMHAECSECSAEETSLRPVSRGVPRTIIHEPGMETRSPATDWEDDRAFPVRCRAFSAAIPLDSAGASAYHPEVAPMQISVADCDVVH